MKAGHHLSEGFPSDRNKSTRPAEAGRVDSVLAGLTYVRMRITRRSRARITFCAFDIASSVGHVEFSCKTMLVSLAVKAAAETTADALRTDSQGPMN